MLFTSHSFTVFLSIIGGSMLQAMGEEVFQEIFRKRSRFSIMSDATYSCRFINRWTGQRHALYPEDAHWSQPILGSHGDSYSMWGPGQNATQGIEAVAETGNRIPLLVEFSADNSTGDFVWGRTTFNREQFEQTLPDITVSREHPFLSGISMVAPSPDWFTGFYDYDTRNGNSWAGEFILLTYPWDAGTEQGDRYSLANPPENPHKPIFQLTSETVPSTGVFLNDDGTDVLPVVKWHCILVDDTPVATPRLRGSNPDLP